MNFIECYLGLGSNLNNPSFQIDQVIDHINNIPQVSILKISDKYKTAAVGYTNQPDFINAVVKISTSLTAHKLLDSTQAVEQAMGRVRTLRWGPRVIDIDILLYGDFMINTKSLQVPHAELRNRMFALEPLAEIAPDILLPPDNIPVKDLLNNFAVNSC